MNPTTPNPMFAKFDQALGKTTPTTMTPPVTSRAEQIRALGKTSTPALKEPGYLERVGGDYAEAGKKITEGIQKGAEDYNANVAKGNVFGAAGSLLRSGLRTAGNVAGAAFAPLTEALKPVMQPVIDKLASSETTKHLVQPVIDLANKHPEVAKDIGNILDLVTLGAGKAVEKPVLDVAKDVAKGSKETIENAARKTSEMLDKKIAERSANKTLDAVSATEDTMTKTERKQAIDEGRQSMGKLGKVQYAPSETEARAGKILEGKLSNNAVKNVPIIKNEIAVRGAEAEKYLAKNPVKISAQEQADMFSSARKTAEKDMTESELGAYDEQMKLFLKQLPGRGGYNTENFYKGLKDYEANVADHLPRSGEALRDPTGIANAKIRAASDIRKVVRDAIGARHPEFKDKMFDLASLYDAKGNIITKAANIKGNSLVRFAKKHPVITTIGVGEGGKKIITGSY